MARGTGVDSSRYEAIVRAATAQFFTRGFDGTSVRAITDDAGVAVGLFYHYFKTKDDVFDTVLERFFADYRRDLGAIAEQARRDPYRAVDALFAYTKNAVITFRASYAALMHRSVRWAIREQALTVLETYIRRILAIQDDCGAVRPVETDVLSMLLAHGVGSIVLHEDAVWVADTTDETRKAVHLLMGLTPEQAALYRPQEAEASDIDGIVALALAQKPYFPGLDEPSFRAAAAACIARRELLVTRIYGVVAGAVAFSRHDCTIDFLALDTPYRGRGAGERLLNSALALLPVGAEVSVVTFPADDPLGAPARRLYGRFGFTDREHITVFDYPCVRMSAAVPAEMPHHMTRPAEEAYEASIRIDK